MYDSSESAWTGYTGTAMQYSELMYDAPTAWALARTSARSFLLIFSFEDRGQLPGKARRERASHGLHGLESDFEVLLECLN